MVIPRMITRALKNEPIMVYGDGNQVRCFTYVTDTVDAIIKLCEHPKAVGQIFNVGNNNPITIKELASKIKEMTGSDSEIVFVPYEQVYEKGFEDMKVRIPDISKICNLTGWQPQIPLETTLQRVAEYYRKKLGLD